MNKLVKIVTACAALSLFSGCATIVGDSDQTLTFTSSPSNAGLVITDERGREVFFGETPSTVTLQKSNGTYFGGKTYRIAFSKPGYDSHEISISAKPNGWYIGGNILLGGVVGWLIVDPWNGHMYTLGEDYIDTTMRSRVAMENVGGHQTLNIALLEELSPESKTQLQPLTI